MSADCAAAVAVVAFSRNLQPLLRLGRAAVTAAAMAQYKGAASEAGRAMHLMKKREKQREQMEQMKQRIAEVRAWAPWSLHAARALWRPRATLGPWETLGWRARSSPQALRRGRGGHSLLQLGTKGLDSCHL